MAVRRLEDQMAVISSGERRQSGLRSFGDLISLSRSQRRQSRSRSFKLSSDLIRLSSSEGGSPHRDFPARTILYEVRVADTALFSHNF